MWRPIHVIRDIVLIPARCGHRPWDIMKHYETIQQSHDAPPALVIKMWRPCLHQGHLHMQLWESILFSFFPICFWLRFPGPRGLPGPPAPALGLINMPIYMSKPSQKPQTSRIRRRHVTYSAAFLPGEEFPQTASQRHSASLALCALN